MIDENSNVILFPKIKRHIKRRAKGEKKAIADAITQDLINNVSVDIITFVLDDLQQSGVEMSPNRKDIGLLVEATKALVSRHYQQPHFLHNLSNNIFDETQDGVALNDYIHFNFRKTKKL